LHFEGRFETSAPRARVWEFVIDPQQVGGCGPGVESVEAIDDDNFRAIARIGIGLFRARFAIDAVMVERDAPNRASVRGSAHAPGSAVSATATMTLSDGSSGGTVMDWVADVDVGGVVASIGAKLLQSVANRMIGQTFECMRKKLDGGQP
jgi:carbon monoxide dehydrogenase subunit G